MNRHYGRGLKRLKAGVEPGLSTLESGVWSLSLESGVRSLESGLWTLEYRLKKN